MTRPGTDDVFFPELVELESGVVEVPVFSLYREHRVRALMVWSFDALSEHEQLQLVENFFSPRVLAKFFAKNPTLWIQLGAEVFGQSEDWIRAHVTMAEIFGAVLRRLAPPPRKASADEESEVASEGWTMARTIEFAAQEWGWSQEEVKECSHDQLVALLDACADRYTEADKAAKEEAGQSGRKSRPSRRGGAKPAASDPHRGASGLDSVRAFARRGNLTIKQS